MLLGLGLGGLLVLLAFAIGQGRDTGAEEVAEEPSSTASTEPSEDSEPEGVTDADLEDFASSYVTTAVDDPRAGFALLTPDYQEASNGLDGYTGFWGGVSRIADFSVSSTDVEGPTVTYTYSYVFNGERRTETVTLVLEEQGDGSLLIAGTA